MEKDTRVVQKTGSSSYTVSLLTEWVEEKVGAGSEVVLHRLGNSVVVSPASEKGPKESEDKRPTARVETAGSDPSELTRTVKALYVKGSDEITVDITDATELHKKRLRDAVSNLTGMVVVSETDQQVVIRNVIGTSAVSVENSIERMSEFSTTALTEATRKALRGKSRGFGTAVNEFDRLRNRFERFLTVAISDPEKIADAGLTLPEVFYAELCVKELSYLIEDAERLYDVSEKGEEAQNTEPLLRLMHKAVISIQAGTEAYLCSDDSVTVQPDFDEVLSEMGSSEADIGYQTRIEDEVRTFLTSATQRGSRLAEIAERMRVVNRDGY